MKTIFARHIHSVMDRHVPNWLFLNLYNLYQNINMIPLKFSCRHIYLAGWTHYIRDNMFLHQVWCIIRGPRGSESLYSAFQLSGGDVLFQFSHLQYAYEDIKLWRPQATNVHVIHKFYMACVSMEIYIICSLTKTVQVDVECIPPLSGTLCSRVSSLQICAIDDVHELYRAQRYRTTIMLCWNSLHIFESKWNRARRYQGA